MQYFKTDNPFQLKVDMPNGAKGKLLSDKTLGVKDLFHIAGYPTTAGNPKWYMTHAIPESTSPVVQRLIDCGCQLLGKTITDELAYSLNGQNIHYGTPSNVKYPEQLPGGSSSGSAIAVANGLIDVGLGTDTGGSIRVPASYNGLFGYRPTHGLVSTKDMVSLAPSFDTVGWLTRDFDTLERVSKVLLNLRPSKELQPKYQVTVAIDLVSQAEHKSQLNDFLQRIQSFENLQLNSVSAPLDLAHLQLGAEAFRVLQAYEIWQTHGEWVTQHQPSFAKDIAERFKLSSQISENEYQQALARQKEFNQSISGLFETSDVIALPTTPGRAPLQDASAEELANYRNALMSMTCIAGLGGLPQIHLPLGLYQGRPTGISLIGKRNADAQLVGLAKQLQESVI